MTDEELKLVALAVYAGFFAAFIFSSERRCAREVELIHQMTAAPPNSALLTDAYLALRAASGAAKRER